MTLSPAHSLLAWRAVARRWHKFVDAPEQSAVLTSSISHFAGTHKIFDIPYHIFAQSWNMDGEIVGFQKGPHGLTAKLPIFDIPESVSGGRISGVMVIACKAVDPIHKRQYTIGLALRRSTTHSDRWYRVFDRWFVNVDCLADMNVPWSQRLITLFDRDTELPSRGFEGTRYTGVVVNRGSGKFSFISVPFDARGHGPWRQLHSKDAGDPLDSHENEVRADIAKLCGSNDHVDQNA